MTIDLRLGDCLELMRELGDKSVDAVITDPPYNVGKDFGETTDDNRDDYEQWCGVWFAECQRISKATLFTPGIGNLGMWLNRNPRWVVAWLKNNSMKRVTVGFNCWEPILLWGNPALNIYRDVVEAAITPHKDNGHPTPKPDRLLEKIVGGFTKEGDTVLDPFMGSGTTGVACVKLNRNFIGYEINPDYFAIAQKRIAEAQLQMAMPL